MKKIILAGGCFWCIEAAYQNLTGITKTRCGYAGGKAENAKYNLVSKGATSHVEAVEITYDETKITLELILKLFWQIHDPTTPNRQGNDIGPQYQAAIFYDTEQKDAVYESYKEIQKRCNEKIATKLLPTQTFYPAEEMHQNYFQKHPNNAYCNFIIKPKIEKVRQILKEN